MRNKTKHVLKRTLAVMVSMAVMVAAMPSLAVFAEETIPEPEIYLGSYDVKQGESVTVSVEAKDLQNVSGLEFGLYYDTAAFTVDYCYSGWLVDSAVKDINSNTKGVVKASFISADGITGSGTLVHVQMTAKANAELKTYPVTLSVSEAYDTALNGISLNKKGGSITVKEKTQIVEHIYFYPELSKYSVEAGEAFSYIFRSGNISDFAGGEFVFSYNPDLMEGTSTSLGDAFKTENAIYQVNKKNAGKVKLSYANTEAVYRDWESFFIIDFKAKDTTKSQAEIKFEATSLLDAELNPMTTSNQTAYIDITKKAVEPVYPRLGLSWNGKINADRTFNVGVVLPADTDVAAGDFTVTYDTDKIMCIDVTADEGLEAAGGIIVANDAEKYSKGTIKFSYINTEPSKNATKLVNMEFRTKNGFVGTTELTPVGKGLVDIDFKDVNLDYKPISLNIKAIDISSLELIGVEDTYACDGSEVRPNVSIKGLSSETDYDVAYKNEDDIGTVTVTGKGSYSGNITKSYSVIHSYGNTWSTDGNYHWYACDCGAKKSNTSHTMKWIVDKVATEDVTGLKHEECEVCKYKRNVGTVIDRLPHTHKMTKIDAKEATCDEAGNITYYSCDKCHKLFADDLGTSEITIVDTVIDPKGHDYDVTKTEKASTTKNGARHLKCKVCYAIDREDIYKVGAIVLSDPVLVYNGKKKTPGVTVTDSQGNVIDKANYSVTYPAKRTKIGKYKVTVTFKGEYTGKKTAEFVIAPKAPSSASATLYGYDDVKFSWKKSTGASGYAVYYKKADATKYTRLKRTTKLSFKKGNLADGVQYKFKVVPYYKSGKTYYESTAYKEVSIYTLKKLNTPVVTKSGSKVKVSWKNIAGETGYQISKATKSGKTSIVATYKTTKGTYKMLTAKKGTKYYYKVRAYKQVGKTKIYGPWSKVKSYKR